MLRRAVRQRIAAWNRARESGGARSQRQARGCERSDTALQRKKRLTSLKVSVKLVQVSVVLRDAKGRAVGNLKKEDFQLFDNGKPQVISSFSRGEQTPAYGQTSVCWSDATKRHRCRGR